MMKKIFKKEKAQVVVVAMAAMLAVFLMVLLVIETGRVVAEKIHMQNTADSAAMEGGLWYSRSLNMISVSNKVLAVAFAVKLGYGIVGAIKCSPGGTLTMIECARRDMAKEKFTDYVRKGQDLFAGTGGKGEKGEVKSIDSFPFLIAGLVALNGKANGVAAVPVFNVEEKENIVSKAAKPDFNVKRKYLFDYIKEIIAGFTGKLKEESEEICRDEESQENMEKQGGVICYKDKHELLFSGDVFKTKNGDGTGPKFLSSSMARIKGGSMKFWDINGASYEARLDKIIVPDITGGEVPLLADFSGDASEFISGSFVLH